MRIAPAALAMAVAILSSPAQAADPDEDEPSPVGLRVGLRTGYAVPLGYLGEATYLFDVVRGHIPFWFDIGARVMPWLYVGAFGSAGVGFLGDSCSGNLSCNATVLRIGLNAHVHFRPRSSFDPWLGVGFGYESIAISISGGGAEQTAKARGLEPFAVQLGGDFFVSRRARLGPFLAFTIAQYTFASSNGIEDTDFVRRLHHWVTLGLRGAYDF